MSKGARICLSRQQSIEGMSVGPRHVLRELILRIKHVSIFHISGKMTSLNKWYRLRPVTEGELYIISLDKRKNPPDQI